MDDLPVFVELFVQEIGFSNMRTSKVLARLLLLSGLGSQIGDDFCGYSLQSFCDTWDTLTERVDRSGRSTVLTSRCTNLGSMEGGRNGSGLDLWLIVIQLDGVDLWGGDRFSFWGFEGEKSGKDGEKDPSEDAGVKGEDA